VKGMEEDSLQTWDVQLSDYGGEGGCGEEVVRGGRGGGRGLENIGEKEGEEVGREGELGVYNRFLGRHGRVGGSLVI